MSRLELDEYFEKRLFVNLDNVKHKADPSYATNWSKNVTTMSKLRLYATV